MIIRDDGTRATARAHCAVARAVLKGVLVRSTMCETCDTETYTVAHHWHGYGYPLDVWWVCRRCNRKLIRCHDGRLLLEQARNYIAMPVAPIPGTKAWRRYLRSVCRPAPYGAYPGPPASRHCQD